MRLVGARRLRARGRACTSPGGGAVVGGAGVRPHAFERAEHLRPQALGPFLQAGRGRLPGRRVE
eukprot:2293-Lingulodinium_polyedra.AAC.1